MSTPNRRTVTITEDGPRIHVRAPFHPEFTTEAKDLNGRFNSGTWTFDARDLERVKALTREFYGSDGSDVAESQLVTVRTHLIKWERLPQGGPNLAVFGGRIIARRNARDARVELGIGVVLVEGRLASSGGSMARPDIDSDRDVVVEVRDLPRGALENLAEGDDYTLVETAPDHEALQAERAALLARLAEVDAVLGMEAVHDHRP